MMETNWDESICSFLELASNQGIRMIMVGSGAMSFYKYQTSSSSLDFWVEATSKNLNQIKSVLKELGHELLNFSIPEQDKNQNFTIQLSPSTINLKLITNFVVDKSFSWAYDDSVEASLQQNSSVKWRVLALEDLIVSKSNSIYPQDLIDLKELKKLIEE